MQETKVHICTNCLYSNDRLCGLVVEFLPTDQDVPCSITGATRFPEK
jgi:hypothetical protein